MKVFVGFMVAYFAIEIVSAAVIMMGGVYKPSNRFAKASEIIVCMLLLVWACAVLWSHL